VYNNTMLFPYSSLAFVCLYGDGHDLVFQLLCCFAYLLRLRSPSKSHCFLWYDPPSPLQMGSAFSWRM